MPELPEVEVTRLSLCDRIEGSRVRAVARCRSKGHKIFMATCDLLDQDDRLLAFGEGVFKRGALRRELP